VNGRYFGSAGTLSLKQSHSIAIFIQGNEWLRSHLQIVKIIETHSRSHSVSSIIQHRNVACNLQDISTAVRFQCSVLRMMTDFVNVANTRAYRAVSVSYCEVTERQDRDFAIDLTSNRDEYAIKVYTSFCATFLFCPRIRIEKNVCGKKTYSYYLRN